MKEGSEWIQYAANDNVVKLMDFATDFVVDMV